MKDYFYIIAPISKDPDYEIKRELLKKVAISKGYNAHFPLDHFKSKCTSLISQIENASFIFADLSFERPSCYYEIGAAQALQKSTFIVAFKNTMIHQIEGEVFFYSNLSEYKNLIIKAINENGP